MKAPTKAKPLLIAVQILIIVGSSWLLYSKIDQPEIASGLLQAWKIVPASGWVLLLLLSILFWFLDTTVWRLILRPFARLSLLKLLRFNVISQSAGIVTPFLVGDYGLRSYLLKGEINARQNTLVTLAYQLVKVTSRISLGILAGLLVSFSAAWSLPSLLLTIVLLVAGAFTIQRFVRVIANSKRAEKLLGTKGSVDFSQLNTFKGLVPAALLFLTFSLQTTLLLFWLQDEAVLYQTWLWVILTYSITSFLPPLSIFDPVAKSAFGAILFAEFAAADAILFAFTVTWLVNRGLPALFSGFFFRRMAKLPQATSSSTI